MNKITRSHSNKMIAGVLGGIAEAYGWHSGILRILFVLFSIFSAAFPGIIVYLVLWMVLPEQTMPSKEEPQSKKDSSGTVER